MSDERPKPAPPMAGPPKLERVPEGYKPPPVTPARQLPQTPSPPAGGASGAPRSPGASYGMSAREVGADAAIAAGLPHQGSLSAESALALFGLAAAMKATGGLTLSAEGRSYALFFRRGTVEHATSSDPQDEIARFLLERGAASPEAIAQAEIAKGAAGGDLVSALIAGRLVNAADVAALLQEHRGRIVQRALSAEAGGWVWDPHAVPPPGAFPLGASFAMLCAAARALDAAALMRRLGEKEHRAATRVGARVTMEDLRLTAQEARAATQFDGVRSPAELAQANPADALSILRLAVLLGELELLAFGPSRKGAPPPEPKVAKEHAAKAAPSVTPAPAPGARPKTPPPAGAQAAAGAARPPAAPPKAPPAAATTPRPAPAAKPPPQPSLDAASLEKLRAKLKDADHFVALDVKPEASAAQIKAAYFQLAKAYHPDALPVSAPPEVRKLCADVFARVGEAWSVLGDDIARAAYLEQLRSGGAANVDVARIFQAETLFEDGTLLVKGRRYDDALRKFEEAMKLNPDEAEFGMWKAWCEFLLAEDRPKRFGSAASAIEAELKRNPRCAQGYLFLGQMAKLVGNPALAEKHLRRGLEVAPEHLEIQRELRYLRK